MIRDGGNDSIGALYKLFVLNSCSLQGRSNIAKNIRKRISKILSGFTDCGSVHSCITYICLENILKALSGRKHFYPSDPWPSSSLVWARAGKINCPTYDELWKTLTLSSQPHTDFFVWNERSESEKAKSPLGEKFSLLFDITSLSAGFGFVTVSVSVVFICFARFCLVFIYKS